VQNVRRTTDLVAAENLTHGVGDGAFFLLGQADDGRTTAAEPSPKSTGSRAGGDDVVELGEERALPVGLVKFVVEEAAQQCVVAGGEHGGEKCDAVEVFDSVAQRDLFGENLAGFVGEDFDVGGADNEFQCSRYAKATAEDTAVDHAGNDEAAEESRGGVVGMAFKFGGDFEDGIFGERAAVEFVEGVHDAEADGDAGTEAAASGEIALDFDLRAVRFDFAATKKCGGSFPAHGVRGWVVPHGVHTFDGWIVGFADSDLVMQFESDAKRVKAGAEIGRGGGHADGDCGTSHSERDIACR